MPPPQPASKSPPPPPTHTPTHTPTAPTHLPTSIPPQPPNYPPVRQAAPRLALPPHAPPPPRGAAHPAAGVFQIILAVAINGQRPPLPTNIPEPVRMLIRCCWDADPRCRPSATQVIGMLDQVRTLRGSGGGLGFGCRGVGGHSTCSTQSTPITHSLFVPHSLLLCFRYTHSFLGGDPSNAYIVLPVCVFTLNPKPNLLAARRFPVHPFFTAAAALLLVSSLTLFIQIMSETRPGTGTSMTLGEAESLG